MTGVLVLEDGSYFEGISIGKAGKRMGEVVLNTAVVGYQEIMTDPANAGKILVLTYPLIGNYGVARKFSESKKSWIEALVIKEESKIYSNWQAEDSFNNFLKKGNLVAIGEVDTRTLAVRIRDYGEMLGIVSTLGSLAGKEAKIGQLVKEIKNYKKIMKKDFIRNISVKKIAEIEGNPSQSKIVILDLGMLNSFVEQLKTLGCNLTLLPYDTGADKILELNLDGLIISNGPEEDEAISGIVEVVEKLIGKIPLLGISLGHEIICLALGGRLRKLKAGHRGVNYPVKSSSYKGDITVQNHSFVVDEESIKSRDDIKITLRNVNDDSIEEMESGSLKFISAQYYPVSPGFDEVNGVFKRFLELVKRGT
ncbi:MAG: glutamine-hydrolyzing carbamoyl-phosphate synthase small subunit [bacterium]